ncbi:MAG: shikimate kinase [Bacteroidales bacterium]
MSKTIYLIGFMGSGKSTAGQNLATILDWHFLDLDELIEKKYKTTITDIFLLSGEKTFRQYESNILHNLNIKGDTVISVGGGAPCFHDNMDFMKRTGEVVYLRMTPAQLKMRLVADKKQRPLLKGFNETDLEKYIELKLSEREPFYLQAGVIEDGFDPDIKGLAEKLMQMFRGRG